MKSSKPLWLDRTLTQCAYFYCLCLSSEEFYSELKRIGCQPSDFPAFISANGHATTHSGIFNGKPVALVCLNAANAHLYTPVQVAALLVHEAVHIWQKHAENIGSHNDHGDEEEAYAIQNISQSLMEEYARRLEVE